MVSSVILLGLPGRYFLIATVGALIGIYETIELHSQYYFQLGILPVSKNLLPGINRQSAIKFSLAYLFQFFHIKFLLINLAIWMPLVALDAYFLTASFSASMIWIAAAIIVLSFQLFSNSIIFGSRASSKRKLSEIEKRFPLILLNEKPITNVPLYTSSRIHNVVASADPELALPETILLIINESAGGDLRSSSDDLILLSEKIRSLAGEGKGQWFMPENVVTNSACTDISIPSILTGCGSHESAGKLHKMPFIFDLAKARGYSTAFFTSSTINWANLDKFLSGASIDKLVTADSENAEIINDLSIDDHTVAQAASNWITEQPGKLFIVCYFNSLHLPFQSESKFAIPASLHDRKARAIFIAESCHQLLFDALKSKRRFDDAFIFSIGDHGETLANDASAMGARTERFTKLTPEILKPLFMMKMPATAPEHLLAVLAGNTKALVANMDVAPTLSNILGAAPAGEQLSYQGFSLLKPIPPERIAYTINTNEWRSWPRGAVAISRGSQQAIVDYATDNLVTLRGLPGQIPDEAEFDELLSAAIAEKYVRISISAILREKMKVKIDPAPAS